MQIKNLIGTGEKECSCGPWLNHWVKFGPGWGSPSCANNECKKVGVLGGHVIKVDSDDAAHYIVPLCDGCNKLKDPFEARHGIPLASANVSKTCAKPEKKTDAKK